MKAKSTDVALLRESIKVTRQAITLIQAKSKLLAEAVKEMRMLNKRLGSMQSSPEPKPVKGRVVIASPSSAAPSSFEPDMSEKSDAELEKLAKGEEQ